MHYVSSIAFLCQQIVSAFLRIKRNRTVQLFIEFFWSAFGCLDTTPLTKKPKVSENHTLPYTSPRRINLPTPKQTAAVTFSWLRNPYQTQTKQTIKVWKMLTKMRTHRSVLRPHTNTSLLFKNRYFATRKIFPGKWVVPSYNYNAEAFTRKNLIPPARVTLVPVEKEERRDRARATNTKRGFDQSLNFCLCLMWSSKLRN